MNPKILIPVDDSKTALKTIEEVIAHKERFPQKVTLLHVVNDQLAYRMIPDFQLDMVRENACKAGHNKLHQIGALLQEAGFETELRLEFGSPRRVIPQVANDEGFELLIIGRNETTGEIRDVLFGSVANFVLHNVKCPVLLF